MKKICLLLGLLSITTFAFSQDTTYYTPQRRHKPKAERPITFGVHAGVNVSATAVKSDGNSVSESYKVGFSGGVDVEFPVSPAFTIQPEPNFSQMGGKEKSLTNATVNAPYEGYTTDKLTLDYLALPVLVKYTVPRSGFSVYLGPQIACLLYASDRTNINGGNYVSYSQTDNYHKIDFSGVLGVEYYFSCRFGVSARYQFGFTNIAKITDVKNRGFTFTLGYRF